MDWTQKLTLPLLVFVGASFAAAPFCDTRSAVRYFAVDSVVEHRFEGTLAANISSTGTIGHSGLLGFAALSAGQDFEFLASFSTSCYWEEQTAQYRQYTASAVSPAWRTKDSTVWIRYIDNLSISGVNEWIHFREDTVAWKSGPFYSNTYLVATPLVSQWYAYASRVDTLTTAQGKSIMTRSISALAPDSATAAVGLVDDWANEEPLADHKYRYTLQVFQVRYSVQENPASLAQRAMPPRAFISRMGLHVSLSMDAASLPVQMQILDARGRIVAEHLASHPEVELDLPDRGRYFLRIPGQSTVLIP